MKYDLTRASSLLNKTYILLIVPANGLRYLRWGGETAKPSTEKKVEAKKLPENAQTPQRRVHALLGAAT
ncbi:MAG TPA: hypothetical protein V6C97_33245 [Oculatellaceae cyanobacterium]